MTDDPLHVDSYKYTFLSKSRNSWKENFAMEYEEFIEVMKKIAPFWYGEVDFSKFYSYIAKVNGNGTFYINDFFILLILFGKYTTNQKMSLIFDMLTGFDETFADKKDEIPYYVLRGVIRFIYEATMVYLPYNELENSIDLVCHGYTSTIKKVVINDNIELGVHDLKTDDKKSSKNRGIDYLRQRLNRLVNFIHCNYHMKEIHLHQKEVLNYIKTVYENELAGQLKDRNKIEITYFTNGMSHKMKIEMDQGWKLIEDVQDIITNSKTTSLLLHKFKNVISLNNPPTIYDRAGFIKVMQRMPMVNYMLATENTELPSTLNQLKKNFRYKIMIDNQHVFTYYPVIGLPLEKYNQ